jgi:hypothetical protein
LLFQANFGKKLPYAVTKHEIQQLLGRHAGILCTELGGGIHIIMERSTAKTMDAFIEFKTQKDAEAVARRLSFTKSGRYPRLGTHHVDIVSGPVAARSFSSCQVHPMA